MGGGPISLREKPFSNKMFERRIKHTFLIAYMAAFYLLSLQKDHTFTVFVSSFIFLPFDEFADLAKEFLMRFTELSRNQLETLRQLYPASVGLIIRFHGMNLEMVQEYFTLPDGVQDFDLLRKIVDDMKRISSKNVN